MRKFLSALLSLCLIFTSVAVLPLIFSAQAEGEVLTEVSFDGAQESFYASNAIADTGKISVQSGDSTHHNVMYFKEIQAYTAARPSWDAEGWNTGRYPSMFRISNSAGTGTMHFKKDDVISVSFKIKNDGQMNTEFGDCFYAAMIFADDYSRFATMDLREFIDKDRTVKLANVSKSPSDWKEYSAIFAVPCDGDAAFLLYCETWKLFSTTVSVDDIVIKKAKKEDIPREITEPTLIDFEGAQKTYHESHRLAYSDTMDFGTVNGNNVGKILRIKGNLQNPDTWNRGYPSAMLVNNKAGTSCLHYEEGAVLQVSFRMKKNAEITNNYSSNFKVAMWFSPSVPGMMSGQVYSYVNGGKSVDIVTIDNTKDTDWKTYRSTVTVPATGYAALYFYRTEWSAATDIYIDDIKIAPLEESEITVKMHHTTYGDPDSFEEITVSNLSDFKELAAPFDAAAKFDGWYLDKDLKNPASGSILDVTDIWAKWRTDADFITNTYDDSIASFSEWNDNSYKMTTMTVGGKSDTMFGQYNVRRVSPSDGDGYAMQFTSARFYEYNWPSLVKIYDNRTQYLDPFVPNPNSVYKISVKYRADATPNHPLNIQLRRLAANGGSTYNKEQIYLEQLAKIDGTTSGWQTAESFFYTEEDVSVLVLQLVSADTDPYPVTGVAVTLDSVQITEVFNTPSITFEMGGASKMKTQFAAVDSPFPAIEVPTYKDHFFDGWFLDSEFTKPFDLAVMPNRNIVLYAKWVEAYSKPQQLNEDFETCHYHNDGKNPNVSDNTASSEMTWNNSTQAHGGKGFLTLDSNGSNTVSDTDFPAVSFLDADQNSFRVIENERYCLKLSMLSEKDDVNLYFVSSNQVPSMSVNLSNSVKLANLLYSAQLCGVDEGTWGDYEFYFIAPSTGKFYCLLSASSGQVLIDDLSVTTADETQASLVTYYNNGAKVSEQFGKVGSVLSDPPMSNIRNSEQQNEKDFDGWRYEDGTLYVGYTFPNKDLNLYASWKDRHIIENTEMDWSKDYVVDFEDTAATKVFYGVYNNGNYMTEGMYFVPDDPAGAHSGKGYYRMNNVGVWTAQWYRRFKFFNSDSDGHQIYLEPFGVYKIGFWLKLEKAGASDVMIATYDNLDHITSCSRSSGINFQDSEQMKNIGKWVYYEDTVTTGESVESIGMILAGGWITASVDDITVTKLKDVTVTFESNGGTEVQPIDTLSGRCIVAPLYPTREGYTFAGWYSDPSCKKKFKFNIMPIEKNMTLYAKWTKDFVAETYYEDVTNYTEHEETVDAVPDDAALDDKITVNSTDQLSQKKPAEKTVKQPVEIETDSGFPMWIVYVAAGVLCLAGLTIIVLVAKKRKKKE